MKTEIEELREQRHKAAEGWREIAGQRQELGKALAPIRSYEKSIRDQIAETYEHNVHGGIIPMSGDRERRRELFCELDASQLACDCGRDAKEQLPCRRMNADCRAVGVRKERWKMLGIMEAAYQREVERLDEAIAKALARSKRRKSQNPHPTGQTHLF